MTRPNISKFQESEIRRAAKAAHLLYLASLPRPLHPDAPAEDEAADAEYAESTQRLVDEATALGRVLMHEWFQAIVGGVTFFGVIAQVYTAYKVFEIWGVIRGRG